MSSVMPTEYTKPMSMPGMKNRPQHLPLLAHHCWKTIQSHPKRSRKAWKTHRNSLRNSSLTHGFLMRFSSVEHLFESAAMSRWSKDRPNMAPAAVMWPFTAHTVGMPSSKRRRMSRSASVWIKVDWLTFEEMYLNETEPEVSQQVKTCKSPSRMALSKEFDR